MQNACMGHGSDLVLHVAMAKVNWLISYVQISVCALVSVFASLYTASDKTCMEKAVWFTRLCMSVHVSSHKGT